MRSVTTEWIMSHTGINNMPLGTQIENHFCNVTRLTAQSLREHERRRLLLAKKVDYLLTPFDAHCTGHSGRQATDWIDAMAFMYC